MENNEIPRVSIIGVPISAVNLDSCVRQIEKHLDEVKGQYICVSNVHTTVIAHDEPDYFRVQAESFLSVPDGKPLSVIGRRQYPQMGRVTGPELMRRLFEESRRKGYRHYFYGNTPENLELLVTKLRSRYPHLNIVGYEPSVFRALSTQEEEELIRRVTAAAPDFLWVGLGAPRQERFCAAMKGRIPALMIGVGGAFNVLAGLIPEAPDWMQNSGLEWLYRLSREPGRLFGRYLTTNTKFLYYQLTKRPPS